MIEKLPENKNKNQIIKITEKDDTFFWGHLYEPDSRYQFNHYIEWIPLIERGNAVLLLSKYALYCKQFDKNCNNWKESELRNWLNTEWVEHCFTDGNEVMVLPTASDNPLNLKEEKDIILAYEKDGFKEKSDDEDFVFLLNASEVRNLVIDEQRRAAPDPVTSHNPNALHPLGCFVPWWIRPENEINCISKKGLEEHRDLNDTDVYIRPAIWMDNYYITFKYNEAAELWKTLLSNAEIGTFDYQQFQKTAIASFAILKLYYSKVNHCYPEIVVEMITTMTKFLAIDLPIYNEEYLLAKNATKALCDYSIKWRIVYHKDPGPGKKNEYSNVILVQGLDGDNMLIDGKTFDLLHPISWEEFIKDYWIF